MINRLLGINSLEATDEFELEEVDVPVATEMPADILLHLDHSAIDYEADPDSVLDMDAEEEELPILGEVDPEDANGDS